MWAVARARAQPLLGTVFFAEDAAAWTCRVNRTELD
jgi:hypothetical protein